MKAGDFARCATFAAIALHSAAAPARDLSPSEEVGISAGAEAVASSNFCNFHIDLPALGRLIEGKSGHLSIDAEGVARVMLMVLAAEAVQEDLLGTRAMSPTEAAQFCKLQILAYGPTGRVAPGILSVSTAR